MVVEYVKWKPKCNNSLVTYWLIMQLPNNSDLEQVLRVNFCRTQNFFMFFLKSNQKVNSIQSKFLDSSQNPWNFLDMEVIMIKEDDKWLSPLQLKSIRVTFLQKEHATRHAKI